MTARPNRADGSTGSGARGWLLDLLGGGLTGAVIGVIAAVNFVIFTGIEQGYESSLGEVFEYSLIAGIVTVTILLAGPVLGVLVARRLRRRRARKKPRDRTEIGRIDRPIGADPGR